MHDIRRIRLTYIREGLSPGDPLAYWSPHDRETIVQRLAEYENTGLSPQGIKSLEDAHLELLKNEKKQGWISVENRLPETFQSVIVCRESKQAIKTTSVEAGMRIADGWWKVFGTRTKSVTHWMPLPDPPEVEV